MVAANFKNCPYLDPSEWWEINVCRQKQLALKIERFYPDLIPVTDNDGKLIDVYSRFMEAEKEGTATKRKQKRMKRKMEAVEKGYTMHYSLAHRSGLLDFLSSELQEKARDGRNHCADIYR